MPSDYTKIFTFMYQPKLSQKQDTQEVKSTGGINKLPKDLINLITQDLDAKSLAVVSSQNKLFNSNANKCWLTLIKKDLTQFPKLGTRESYTHFYKKGYQLLKQINKETMKSFFDPSIIQKLFAEVIEGGYEKLIPLLYRYVNLSEAFALHIPNNTYLHLAALNGYPHIVSFLLKEHVPVDPIDSGFRVANTRCISIHMAILMSGTTPLSRAAENGHLKCMELLIEAKANINYKSRNFGDTPLHHAARGGKIKCIKALLDAKARLNVENNDGKIPLQIAEENGYSKCAKLILNNMHKRGVAIPHKKSCVIF